MKTTAVLDQSTVDQFIIEMSLVVPVQKIINDLESNKFRDCDIKLLDTKMEKFVVFACQTLGLENIVLPDRIQGKVLNDYTRKQYLNRFNTLLNYLKTL